MYIHCLVRKLGVYYVYTNDIKYISLGDTRMNLQTAKSELKGRSSRVGAGELAVETVVVVGLSMLLVGFFA